MLDGLQAEGEAEVLVHWALAEDIRALEAGERRHERRASPLPMALRENRMWGAKERLFERILPKASDAALAQPAAIRPHRWMASSRA
jgi:DNA polymerase-3 subunit delta